METILSIPVRIFGFFFKHPRVIVLVVIGVFIFFGISTCNGLASKSSTPAVAAKPQPPMNYQTNAPDVKTAQFILLTDSRIYYVTRYTAAKDKQSITLNDYWVYDSKTWARKNNDLPVAKKYYRGAKLYDRTTDNLLVNF